MLQRWRVGVITYYDAVKKSLTYIISARGLYEVHRCIAHSWVKKRISTIMRTSVLLLLHGLRTIILRLILLCIYILLYMRLTNDARVGDSSHNRQSCL